MEISKYEKMVSITVDLVRKKAEHHDGELAPLREISLHQEGIEKLEHIQNWCPKLQILLLQSNLIPKIENLNRLKELEYLNLAINNIERIENLERCESLQKLDLTLNFIGELTSIVNLKKCYNLRQLYLVGNPCADYEGYRAYTIATLTQIDNLDGEEITRTERIQAIQKLDSIQDKIAEQQQNYAVYRREQKARMQQRIVIDCGDGDDEIKQFWNEKTEHCPEMRTEIEKHRLMKNKTEIKQTELKKRSLFASDGRPLNINEAKIDFRFNDNPNQYELELKIYRYLDTSLIDVDVQPNYIRVTIKNKIFQLTFSDEVNPEKSIAKRSTSTGFMSIIMPKFNNEITVETPPLTIKRDLPKVSDKREYLEIGSAVNIFDFTKPMRSNLIGKPRNVEKSPSVGFIDDPDVPPLV